MFRTILLTFILSLSPLTALGCSCISEAKTYEETFKKYDAIFTGIALNTETTPGDWSSSFYKTEMQVQKVWKNRDVMRSVFIKTYTERNSCGGPVPTIGNRFLVFAHSTPDGLYVTGGCSMFMDLDQTEKEVGSLSSEAKLEWEAIKAGIWSALGKPFIVF
ncbi:hypothetical protein EXU30_02280 [Shewanella maritima]|uniref:Lipoprotein n=1 Tax=Shewanella maritima TaxID=2520507 RepID=A0A411PDT2_9GAMM|nr:hypothetical protein [Shewanella maritima]QBF81648.1 hypothetical protein EXU30_02280 [Shewanella maritima]